MDETPSKSGYTALHGWTPMATYADENPLDPGITGAKESHLTAVASHVLTDASGGLWTVPLGHGREDVIAAMTQALRDLTYQSTIGLKSHYADRLARRLVALDPRMARVQFHTTGTAAVEGAILVIRQAQKAAGDRRRTGILAFDRAYHGCSYLGVSVSGNPEDQEPLTPLAPGVHRLTPPVAGNDPDTAMEGLRAIVQGPLGPTISSFVFEPVMGVAGVHPLPRGWLEQAIALCRANGIAIIADEVATGFGRTGKWFASEGLDIDAMAIGKGLGGGYVPLSATLFSSDIIAPITAEDASEVKTGSTMDGYPAACAAGLAIIDAIEREQLIGRAETMGKRFMSGLKALEKLPVVGEVRGRGLFAGIDIVDPHAVDGAIAAEWYEKILFRLATSGIFVTPFGDTLVLAPPLTISEEELDGIVDALHSTFEVFSRRMAKAQD
jgi:putrescine aminotransferase